MEEIRKLYGTTGRDEKKVAKSMEEPREHHEEEKEVDTKKYGMLG